MEARDIGERLRDGGNDICRDGPMWPGDDMLEGYAEITRLRALVEELKADRIRINDEAETEIKRLRELVFEMAGELESEIDYRYRGGRNNEVHPALQRKYDNDMDVCRRARKAPEGGE